MTNDVYIKLEDALGLLPENDVVGPKPSYLRKALTELPAIIITEMEDDTK